MRLSLIHILMALQIEQVTVVAKMRSIRERNGRVVLDFIVTLPRQLLGKSRSVVITPILHKPDESVALEDLVIRGGRDVYKRQVLSHPSFNRYSNNVLRTTFIYKIMYILDCEINIVSNSTK